MARFSLIFATLPVNVNAFRSPCMQLDGRTPPFYASCEMNDPHCWTIEEITTNIQRKSISPREIVQHYLQRSMNLQPRLNSFVHMAADSALEQAAKAEASLQDGVLLGPLHGVPITIKSCIDVAEWPCAAGSVLRKDVRSVVDAVLVKRLRDAGGILLGNTNTPEFLMAYESNNLLNGKTSNPWNTEFSCGGSSGGEAAAIASGCSAGGVGSDGGGSIRVPAHFCGICGLKPTPGRIPSTGHYPPGTSAFGWLGVVGPMARSIRDLRILFDVLSGPNPDDALTTPAFVASQKPILPKNIRIGILEGDGFGKVTPETQSAVRQAAQLLAYEGFILEPFRLPYIEQMLDLWWFFFGTVISQLYRAEIRGREGLLSPIFLDYLEAAKSPESNDTSNSPVGSFSQAQPTTTMEEFVKMCAARDSERARILRPMSDIPILLSPVCSAPAFRHGEGTWQHGTGYRETMRHSQWLNLAGFPGITLPMGKSPDGVPIGVQLVGVPHQDELLFEVAELLENLRGPFGSPDLS
jgi:Asp-tRNA(Asn)/Glu-tRNA(Gln) amidotransferase A subunit family amidase